MCKSCLRREVPLGPWIRTGAVGPKEEIKVNIAFLLSSNDLQYDQVTDDMFEVGHKVIISSDAEV